MNNQLHNQSYRGAYEAELADQLRSALIEATGGQIVSSGLAWEDSEHHRLDLLLTLTVGGESVDIAVEMLRNGYPRDIREAVWHLDEFRLSSGREHGLIPMVAAESLSPGAKELLRKRGIGYFERNGTLYLRWRHWLINIERPRRTSAKKKSAALFTDAREKVVHALLVHRNEWLTGSELAELAETSTYTCSKVLRELELREWCESSGAGRTLRRRLIQPEKLLDAWGEEWVSRKDTRSRWYVFANKPDALLMHLTYQIERAKITTPWAFTGAAAANVYAPLLTSTDTAEIIVSQGQAELLANALGLKPAEKGGNVTLVERDGASLLFRDLHPDYPSYFASPFILYLDLLDGRGRNKELAQHVREKLEL
ncbi:MAG: type IV toxin-antitoxin system AbiEi family antitoxin [Sedimenticola sp.]